MANHTEPRSVIEGVIPTPKMPPSLQSLPNELKQQIAANLIVPLDDPNSSLTLLYPPRHNQLIDTSSILALRLVSKDMRDNAATTFETVISEICIGPHESSLDRFVKISEDPYFKQHIRHITFSSGISNLNGIYHPSQLHQDLRSHYLYELIESFCNNEHRMLFSGIYTLKIVRGLSNLTRCDSITISGGQWSLESTRLIQSVYGAIDAATDAVFGHGLFIKDLREGESQILSAVCHAVSNSRIRLQELNIYCHERTSALMDVFDEDRLDTATFGPQFS
ncbi:hypothetical protein E6O75_ATG06330 [Venturia nashicola]|uniref:F-box domain-containing protein n=1 Tax=Venturia nashicola TaxID=86259 RepID=A0A4Z1P800_9PEZI|nr:hypothetical protein E6O75_ATG06330 [Venturia nashicola]